MNICCIYKITNPSGRVYIGQTRNLKKRYQSGVAKSQTLLYRSYEKYGAGAHAREILQELPADVDQEIIDEIEKHLIYAHKELGYQMLNIRPGGNGHRLSEETIERLKVAHKQKVAKNPGWMERFQRAGANASLGTKRSDETRKKQSESHKGKIRTAEHSANISAAKKGRPSNKKGIRMTAEQIEKNRLGHIGIGVKPVEQYTKDGIYIKTWSSVTEAGCQLNIARATIGSVAAGRKSYKTAGGFVWKYEPAIN